MKEKRNPEFRENKSYKRTKYEENKIEEYEMNAVT
jgi:hypothetical protein